MFVKSKANALSYGLINGLVSIPEVVAWADGLLAESDSPEEWLINLSLCGSCDPKDVISLLHQVPGQSSESEASSIVVDYLARQNKPFALFDSTVLPVDFRYPDKLVSFSETGQYPYMATAAFLDADWKNASDLIDYVQAVNPAFVPFAQEDDRFTCFLSPASDQVFIVDIVEHASARLGTFDSWLERVVKESQVYVGTA